MVYNFDGHFQLTGTICAAAVFFLISVVPLQASDTIIGFDDLTVGTKVSTQYHAQGVDLDTKPHGGDPVVATDSEFVSPPNVLDISFRYPIEFPGAYLEGTFTNPHHVRVSVRVHGRGFSGSPATGTTTLTARDLSGNLVATATAVAPQPGNGFVLLEAVALGTLIASFEVICDNDLLYVDDLSFDTLAGGPEPDFAAFAQPVQLAVGGSASSVVTVRRFNGSAGDILLEVSSLPPGVMVAGFVPDPVSGPDGSTALLTLASDSSAVPVQDWPLKLSGLPSATAGQFGPHTITFPLTILDSFDAQVSGIEVTQGIQYFDLPAGSVGNKPLHGVPVRYNGMPLAVGGTTVVRAFPDYAVFPEHSTPPDFLCTLVGSRNGVPLPGNPLVAVPGPGKLILGPNFVDDRTRARPTSVCNFTLPAAWTQGIISLTAAIQSLPQFGPPTALDCCSDNDSFTLTDIAFTPTRELFFAPFALRVNHGFLGFPDDIFEEARNLLPIGDLQFHMGDYAGEIDITDIWNQNVKACGFLGTDSCPEDATGRGNSVTARLKYIADDLNFTDSGELVVGIYPQNDPVSGMQDRIRGLYIRECAGPFWDCDKLSVMAAQNQGRPLTSVAHELGHMLGRAHASFACGAGDVDNNGDAEHWPPDERGFLQGVGVDRRDFSVRFPDRTGGNLGGPFFDFMSYCTYGSEAVAWISQIGWKETLQGVATGAPGSSAKIVSKATKDATAPNEQVLVVQGFIDAQNNVYITKVTTDNRPSKSPPASSPYHLVVFGPANKTLSDTAMDLVASFGEHGAKAIFLSAQSNVSGAETVEIQENGKAIARRMRRPNAPKVWDVDIRVDADQERCGSETKNDKHNDCEKEHQKRVTVVSWKTKHAEGVPLMAKVDYSIDDDKTWRPVFFGPNHDRAEFAPGVLTDAQDARIRVRINDGFNESTAVSRHFHVSGAPPAVRITSPKPGTTIKAGESLYLSAQAYDGRRQILEGTQLSWYSGPVLLGTGNAISVTSLSAGKHEIELIAKDARGRKTRQMVSIQVDF